MTQHTNQPIQNGLQLGTIVQLVSQYRWFVLAASIIALLLGIGATVLLSDFEYRADSQLLVVQYSDSFSVDGERTLRSTENISRNLTKIINTTTFMDAALAYGQLPRSFIAGDNDIERKREWNNKVSATAVPNSALIKVSAYDSNPNDAIALAEAVTTAMIQDAPEYHGADQYAIEVKQIDRVLVSDAPVRPNILLTAVAAFFAGFAASVVYLLFTKEWRVAQRFITEWYTEHRPGAAASHTSTAAPQPESGATDSSTNTNVHQLKEQRKQERMRLKEQRKQEQARLKHEAEKEKRALEHQRLLAQQQQPATPQSELQQSAPVRQTKSSGRVVRVQEQPVSTSTTFTLDPTVTQQNDTRAKRMEYKVLGHQNWEQEVRKADDHTDGTIVTHPHTDTTEDSNN